MFRLFQVTSRLVDRAQSRRREIYFLSMTFFIVLSAVIGGNVFIKYYNDPMFANPETIMQHFATPLFIALVTMTAVLFFGLFFTTVISMAPFKRLRFYEMEFEFENKYAKEIMVANQFTFISTMLNNNSNTIREMISNNTTELHEVVEQLALKYKRFVNEYNSGVFLEIEVCKEEEVTAPQEKKLLEEVKKSPYMSNTFVNRVLNGTNLMVGVVEFSPDVDRVVLIARSNYDYPFDNYDKESIASLIEYSIILYEMINMVTLLPEESDEGTDDSGNSGSVDDTKN